MYKRVKGIEKLNSPCRKRNGCPHLASLMGPVVGVTVSVECRNLSAVGITTNLTMCFLSAGSASTLGSQCTCIRMCSVALRRVTTRPESPVSAYNNWWQARRAQLCEHFSHKLKSRSTNCINFYQNQELQHTIHDAVLDILYPGYPAFRRRYSLTEYTHVT